MIPGVFGAFRRDCLFPGVPIVFVAIWVPHEVNNLAARGGVSS